MYITDNSALIAAVLEQTDPGLAIAMDSQNTWKQTISQNGARVALYRQYEEGEHRASITDQMRSMLRIKVDGTGINEFNDNYCEVIVSKMADRLYVNEISLGDKKEDNEWLKETLERNNFISIQDSFWRNSIIDGDTFVCIDPVHLKWSIEPVYDGWDGIVGIFDETNTVVPVWVCKLWSESSTESSDIEGNNTIMKIMVYQGDKITYWKGKPGTNEVQPDDIVQVETVEGEHESTNYRPWSSKTPYVRFANRLSSASGFGRSELRNAITLQDVLNRTIHSMVMASEFGAFTILWSIGMEIDATGITPGAVVNMVLKDKSGKVLTELTEEAAAFLEACRVGQFNATPMDQYLNQINSIAKELSHNTNTPIYGITTQGQVSGDALRQLEVGLIGKVERFQRSNTEAIKTLIMMTAQIQNSFANEVQSDTKPPETIDNVNVMWKSAELLNTDEKITTFTTLRRLAPGLFSDEFYRTKIGSLLGMKKEDIDKESEQAIEQQVRETDKITGANGEVPMV